MAHGAMVHFIHKSPLRLEDKQAGRQVSKQAIFVGNSAITKKKKKKKTQNGQASYEEKI